MIQVLSAVRDNCSGDVWMGLLLDLFDPMVGHLVTRNWKS
jgi:hypothetical protein